MRLGHSRPRGAPAFLGRSSVNAAHRIAVEWDRPDGAVTGVYIPRRDTGSALNSAIGGRFFPGDYQRARFSARDTGGELHVSFQSDDGCAAVDVRVEPASDLGSSRLFADVDQASAFFQEGSVGYSATRGCEHFDGMELRTDAWKVEPVRVRAARSSYFEDPSYFPPGSATLDCALLMRDVPVRWHALDPMRSAQPTAATAP
jgi:hypothetical protein